MQRDTPAEFRILCETYGVTINGLAAKFTDGRTDNVRKWWKTQIAPDAAWEWLHERETAIHALSERIADAARAEADTEPDETPVILTYRTDNALEPLNEHDPDLTAYQHRAAATIAARELERTHTPYSIEFWEDY